MKHIIMWGWGGISLRLHVYDGCMYLIKLLLLKNALPTQFDPHDLMFAVEIITVRYCMENLRS